MIITKRLFERLPPSRDAKSIFIFCEGVKREYHYFTYFKEIDSRINVEVHQLHPEQDNSPLGLLNIAKQCIIQSDENPDPLYTVLENDEVWIVLDTDKDKDESRKPQIKEVSTFCKSMLNWNIAESNPCFEVWLYYHTASDRSFLEDDRCKTWKQMLNKNIPGGFDSRRHPVYIEDAIINSGKNYYRQNDELKIGSTDVHKLAINILALVKQKIDDVLSDLKNN